MPTVAIQKTFELALQHHRAGRLAEAEVLYCQVLALMPNHDEALHFLGVIAHQIGRSDLAVERIRRALAFNLNNPGAHSNLGEAYRAIGRLDDAIAAYRHALQLKPDYAEAYYNLGNALKDRGNSDDAIAAYRRALQLKPDYLEAHNNMGATLRGRCRIDEAIAAYRCALQLNPEHTEVNNNLGNALKDLGQLGEAIAAYRRALQFSPNDARVHSNLIYALHFHSTQDGTPIDTEHWRWNRQFADPVKQFVLPYHNDRSPDRRLRIGYVSPDFREHVVGRNMMPLFACHDRGRFEVICYSGVVRRDQLTEWFRGHSCLWRGTVGVADEALAEMVRQDGVDILVDLTQHMNGNRLPVFARRPAPVQVSFAGYPASTGLEAIDYRISDRWLESESQRRPSERVHLIDSFWCYDPCGMEVMFNDLPANVNGWITFGSLNNFGKINDPVLALWARVLTEVKGSRLLLLSGYGSHRQRTVDFLAGHGVEAERVEFVAPCPRKDYLELYHRLDVALDPFPYGGHATSLDALWMGVPVVSLAGERAVSRGGLSILNNLGLPELVTFKEDQYVEIAVRLANDLPRLTDLRRTLRSRMENSVLMDGAQFARQIETACRAMWREWCTQQESSSQ